MRRCLLALLLFSLLGAPTPAQAAGQVRGVDVSRYQHPNGAVIDWRAARAAGASFVYVKALEGFSPVNGYYADDVARARSAGLVAGAYHFARPSYPLTSAVEQANAFLRTIGEQRRSLTLPPALDLETTGGLSRGDLTVWAQLWLDEVGARTGRTPVLYSYPSFLDTAVHGPALHNALLWIATYGHPVATPIPGGWDDYAIWQNTGGSPYPGFASPVDTNLFSGTPAELALLADGTAPSGWPITVASPPVGVSLSQRSRGTLRLRWLPGNDGGTKTTGWRATISDGRVVDLPATGTSFVLSGLDPALNYTVSVRAVTARGLGAAGGSNLAQPVGNTAVTMTPGGGTAGTVMTASGRLTTFGGGLAGVGVQVQRLSGSTWSTLATPTTAADGTWRWTSTVSANQVLRAVFPGGNGYVASSTPPLLRAVTPALTVVAPHQVRPGGTWTVAAKALPAEARVIRLLVLLGGRFTVVSSATTDSRGVVHLAWRGAQAGNRTSLLEVGAAAGTMGLTRRLDVVVR